MITTVLRCAYNFVVSLNNLHESGQFAFKHGRTETAILRVKKRHQSCSVQQKRCTADFTGSVSLVYLTVCMSLSVGVWADFQSRTLVPPLNSSANAALASVQALMSP